MKTNYSKFVFILFLLLEYSGVSYSQYSSPQILQSTTFADLQNFQVVDFNNDGIDDIVALTGPQGGSITHFIKGTSEGFTIEKSIVFPHFLNELVFFDFDNDGDLDLYSNNRIYENQNLDFIDKGQLTGISFVDILIYDMDQDGKDDIVPGIWHLDDSQTSYPYFKNQGDLNFTLVGEAPLLVNSSKIKMLDIDKDGKNEIVTLHTGEPNFFTLLGGNNVEKFTYTEDYPKPSFRDIYVDDIDGDGWDEIIDRSQNGTDIIVYFFQDDRFVTELYDGNEFISGLLIYDYDDDGVSDIIGYGHDYQFISYKNDQLVLENFVNGPEAPQTYEECKLLFKDSEAILLRARFHALYKFDLENENLSDGQALLNDISQNRGITAITSDNSNLGYSFIEDNNLKVLRVDPITKQKKYKTTPLKGSPISVSLTELEPNLPVYIISYLNDNGLYIVDANNPTEEEINTPKFTLSNNAPTVYTKQVEEGVSVLINDGLDIYRISFDSNYKLDYLRNMNNIPIELIEVDVNHDQQKDIVWKSNYSIWYSAKIGNDYADFVKLNFEPNLPLGNSLLYDYDEDGELEIITSQFEKIIVLEIDNTFNLTKTEFYSENLLYFNPSGSIDENFISLVRSDGHIQIIDDLQDYLLTNDVNIDVVVDPYLAGLTFLLDLDSDNDLDLLIRNRYYVSASLFGDILSTVNKENTLQLYPNPTSGIFNVKSTKKYEIKSIYDINGIQYPKSKNLTQFPNGIYFINILIDNNLSTIQIIKTD